MGRTWQISGRICLPCGKNLSSGHIAKCDPSFQVGKNFENREKHEEYNEQAKEQEEAK